MNMKYPYKERIFLNIGFTFVFGALLFLSYQIFYSACLRTVTGTVTECVRSHNDLTVIYHDKTKEVTPMYDYTVIYTDPYGRTGKVYRWGEADEYTIGQTVSFKYSVSENRAVLYPDDFSVYIILFAVSGAFLIFLCRDALKGYKRDFIKRYPKAFTFTAITAFIPVVYHYTAYLHPEHADMFEGLAEALTLLALLILVPVVNIIVWIAAAVRYYRKNKTKYNNGVDENGSVAE